MTISKVGLAIKTSALNENLGKVIAKVFKTEENILVFYEEKEQGVILVDELAWDLFDSSIQELHKELRKLNFADFILVEIPLDFPDSTESCLGCWTDNPWELRVEIKANIKYNS